MSKACANCGAPNADEAKFCRACGKAFEAPPQVPLPADDSTIIARAPYLDTEPPPDSEATVFMQPASDATVIMPRVRVPEPSEPLYSSPPEPQYPPPADPPYAPPSEPYYAPAPEPYVPMPTGPGSLPPTAHDPSAATRKSMAVWIGLAVVLLVAIAAAIAWFMQSRPATVNTFDSAPPPSVLAASSPAAAPAEDLRPASAPEFPAPVAADAASAASPSASSVTAPVPDSFDNAASAPAIGTSLAPESSDGAAAAASTAAADTTKQAAAKEAAARDRAAREAKAKALREQRLAAASQAAADAARKRPDEPRPKPASVVAAAATVSPAPAPAEPVAAHARTVAETCTSGNSLVRGICEARECVGSEHSNEDICRRIRAADDRRRQ